MINGQVVRFGFRPIWGSHYAHIAEVIGERITPQVVKVTTQSMCMNLVPTSSDFHLDEGEMFTVSTVGVDDIGAVSLYYGTYTHGLEACSRCLDTVKRLGESDIKIQRVFLNTESFKRLDEEHTWGRQSGDRGMSNPNTDLNEGVEKPAMLGIFTEANTIINGSRRKDYGPVNASLQSVAKIWTAYLQNLAPEIELDEMNIIEMNILMKISRAMTGGGKIKKRKRDTYRDIVGYAGLGEMIDGLADDDIPIH
jgi:hypothetical protein